MRTHARTIVLVSGALVLLGSVAQAATIRSVTASDNAFTPVSLSALQGDTVRWTNSGALAHTTSSTITGTVGWNGTIAHGASFSKLLSAAGTYAYHCSFHSRMLGSVRIPVTVRPATGPVGTVFTVTLASAVAPSGFRYAPAVKAPGSTAFTNLPETSARSVTYKATRVGTYAFRSLVKHGSLPGTAPSPGKSVTVG
jgi:plastocyanin